MRGGATYEVVKNTEIYSLKDLHPIMYIDGGKRTNMNAKSGRKRHAICYKNYILLKASVILPV